MSALPAAYDEAAYLREQLQKLQARLSAEIQRCGRAEGALRVTEEQLAAALKDVAELRGEVADVREERDALEDVVHGDAS